MATCLANYTATRQELLERSGDGGIADGTLRIRIGLALPLARAGDAHGELEGRRTTGKVLLLP